MPPALPRRAPAVSPASLLTRSSTSPSNRWITRPTTSAGFLWIRIAAARLTSILTSFQARAHWRRSPLPSVLSQPLARLWLRLRLRSSLPSAFHRRTPASPLPATALSATVTAVPSRGTAKSSISSLWHKSIPWWKMPNGPSISRYHSSREARPLIPSHLKHTVTSNQKSKTFRH